MTLDDFTKYTITCVTGFCFGVLFTIGCTGDESSPVEKDMHIDSLTKVNNKIKVKVEKLDSIKDAKVIEVSTLNNDSTLKLFYKLVSE